MATRRDALAAEWTVVRDWVAGLLADPDADGLLSRPSVLDGWTVRELVAHLSRALSVVSGLDRAPRGARPLSIDDYVAQYGDAAEQIAAGTRELASSTPDLSAALDASWTTASARLDELDGDDRTVVQARRGAIRLGDLLVTRLVELVVHGDDLARSLPDREPPVHDPAALRAVVRALLDTLSVRAPGRAVEVRVPPFAATQCVEGGSHTRGTPPNVVETDALTWVRVACGRTRWDDEVAAGRLHVSGVRAGAVADVLPLL